MNLKNIAKAYIKHLENGDIDGVISLFNENGSVDSPLYGVNKASLFYTTLSNDTTASELKIKGIFEEQESNRVALFFEYTWIIKNGKTVTFDVMDVLTFNDKQEIISLQIIYDTVNTRVLFEEIHT